MGRHFWTKHIGDEHDDKQPGCVSGLINVLDYHHWNSNTRKVIHHNKYACQTGDWSPKTNLLPHSSCEVEKLLDEKQSPFVKTKRPRGNDKRSLKSRIKALISEEIYKDSNNAQTKEGFLFKSRLQRTYSIHHLEPIDDSISKICTDWKNPIIFIPSKLENSAPRPVDITQSKAADSNEANSGESNIFSADKIGSVEKTDFLDILKIDKELFVKDLLVSDESVNRFSRNGLTSNGKLKLSKSRSFPNLDLPQRLKFKPSKLADKQKEIWSFPKGEKLQAVSREVKLARSDEKDQDPLIKEETQQKNEFMVPSDIVKGIIDVREETPMGIVGENTMRNYSHSRSSSLNESLDKYARLFENSYGTDAKLNLSRSMRLTNENGHASMYFRRTGSLSNADSFYSNLNLVVVGDDAFGNGSFVIEKDDSFRQDVVEDDENVVRLVARDSKKEPVDLVETVQCKTESVDVVQRMDDDLGLNLNTVDENIQIWEDFKEEPQKLKSVDFLRALESINGSDPCSISDSYTISQEKLSGAEQLKISEDKFVKTVGHYTDSGYVRLILDQSGIANDAYDRAWHASDQPLSPQIFEDMEVCWPHEHCSNYFFFDKFVKTVGHYTDSGYVRLILDQSGIANDAYDRAWHASDQPLSPQIFEDMEVCWPHEHDQLTSWPDFCSSCWQHQMLFDLVNETLVETYDVSLPYYPKALSSSCHIRSFPVGNRIIEEVSTSISKLLNLTTDEKQSLDGIMVRDLKDDYRWMNLQFESECIGLELEDMIFDDLLEELSVLLSYGFPPKDSKNVFMYISL